MKDPFEQVNQFIEALRAGHKPKRFRVEEAEDRDALALVAHLIATSDPTLEEPDPLFVARLGQRLEMRTRRSSEVTQGRRRLLAAAFAGLAAGLGSGVGLDRVFSTSAPPQPPAAPSIPLVRDNGRWFAVAKFSELPNNAVVRFTAGALEGHLVKRSQDVQAVSAICSHMPCTLLWQEQGEHFLCPCHDATFHPDGEVKFARRPYPPLTHIEVKIQGDQVLVWSIGEDPTDQTSRPI